MNKAICMKCRREKAVSEREWILHINKCYTLNNSGKVMCNMAELTRLRQAVHQLKYLAVMGNIEELKKEVARL